MTRPFYWCVLAVAKPMFYEVAPPAEQVLADAQALVAAVAVQASQ